jgi:tRNA-binding protein
MEIGAEKNVASYADFERLDIRVGTITTAEHFPKAKKPAYRLTIDFGNGQIRNSSAQITEQYTPERLVGKQVIAIVNFPPKQVANFISEVLVLGVLTTTGVVLLTPDQPVENGTRIA